MFDVANYSKRILDPQTFNLPTMLEIFAVERFALAFESRCDDDRVVPRQAAFPCYPQSLNKERRRGVDCQQGTEYRDQILFGFGYAHGLRKAPKGNIEEFLYDLIAYDSLPTYLPRLEPIGPPSWPWQARPCQTRTRRR